MVGFVHFRRVLVLRETQTTSFRIWSPEAKTISNDDNRYATVSSYSSFFGLQHK